VSFDVPLARLGASFDDRVRAVLGCIHDPCSVAAGRPTSVLDLGLVLGWALEDGVLTVRFCVTFPGCTMAPHFTEAAARDLAALPGVERVETVVDTGWEWTPPAPRAMTGKPQAWRERVSPPRTRSGRGTSEAGGGAWRGLTAAAAQPLRHPATPGGPPPRAELGED
jgi:metal-sulfur cluster biosynthetic enzyme